MASQATWTALYPSHACPHPQPSLTSRPCSPLGSPSPHPQPPWCPFAHTPHTSGGNGLGELRGIGLGLQAPSWGPS